MLTEVALTKSGVQQRPSTFLRFKAFAFNSSSQLGIHRLLRTGSTPVTESTC